MADPLYTCCEDGMLSQVPPTDRSGLCPACKATAERVGVSLKRVVDNFVAERARGIGAAPSATAHLSKYEDAASTGNEGVTNWTGCGECDCAFACYHGRTRCIRLPADGVAVVAPSLYNVVPPSAAEWLSDGTPPGAASQDWLDGWNACRNRARTLLDTHIADGVRVDAGDRAVMQRSLDTFTAILGDMEGIGSRTQLDDDLLPEVQSRQRELRDALGVAPTDPVPSLESSVKLPLHQAVQWNGAVQCAEREPHKPVVLDGRTVLAVHAKLAAGVPEAQPQQEKNMELPDAIRVPLDELEADAAYIIGRVAADGSCSGIMVEAIRKRTRAIREALLAHGAQGSARDHNEVMALVYLYGSHCAEHPEDAAGQQERLAGVKTALGVTPAEGSQQP